MVATLRTPAARLIAALGLSASLIVPPVVLRPSATETSIAALPSVVGHSVGSVAARVAPSRVLATKRLSAPPVARSAVPAPAAQPASTLLVTHETPVPNAHTDPAVPISQPATPPPPPAPPPAPAPPAPPSPAPPPPPAPEPAPQPAPPPAPAPARTHPVVHQAPEAPPPAFTPTPVIAASIERSGSEGHSAMPGKSGGSESQNAHGNNGGQEGNGGGSDHARGNSSKNR